MITRAEEWLHWTPLTIFDLLTSEICSVTYMYMYDEHQISSKFVQCPCTSMKPHSLHYKQHVHVHLVGYTTDLGDGEGADQFEEDHVRAVAHLRLHGVELHHLQKGGVARFL